MKFDLSDSVTNLPDTLGSLVLPEMQNSSSWGQSRAVAGAVSAFLIPAYLQNEPRMAALLLLLQISPSMLGLSEEK